MEKKDNQEVVALLKGMQRQLDSLEKKIDSLSRQSKPREFSDKRFSAPRKEYDRAKQRRGEKKEGDPCEGKFYHGHPFGKKKEGEKSSFKRNKKPFKKSSKNR